MLDLVAELRGAPSHVRLEQRKGGSTLEELRYLADVAGAAFPSGLGQMAGGPINSALHFFGEELAKLSRVG